ncbi:MAG: glycosyl hydrolase family 5 [Chloroflexi bacterium AL-W]|nr:glycosyl hydrolase family 5 [Chloroflexi bacterium AL-N1]NOK69408.1 glycosyl hydrolase family 5 [Chloroflexi bacterium AL-N10]NOK76469.1 glycosyl hydrolase family 5 [Chloroflexi bacterium AL-N5]NOK83586.1 glycosyl hydrolase family 5 [Chloroflexi bacterium AL-W]NOK91247.1 glycosyl hydrolase family 5 [Chloroflexi bacterium AL-N15]
MQHTKRSITVTIGLLVVFALGSLSMIWSFATQAQMMEEDAPAITNDTERITNGTFDENTNGWWTTANTTLEHATDKACFGIPGGTTNPWDVIAGQDNILLEEGQDYLLTFDAYADAPITIRSVTQLGQPPYTAPFSQDIDLTTETQSFEFTFVSTLSIDNGQFLFQVGGSADTFNMCFDNVSLKGGNQEPPTYEPDTGSTVRVNQVGYIPTLPKYASVVTDTTTPLMWELKDQSGNVVESGNTTVFGYDEASDDPVHLIDFSDFDTAGTDYVLDINGIESYPFDLSTSLYDQLRYDALTYFYHNRSGIEIDSHYVGEEYARPAGHIGVEPNQGDTSVSCAPDIDCDYALDVSGGWYDAGDYGKYVVNGGISLWTMLNQYERTFHIDSANTDAFADGKMAIPEDDNDVPDILDEARWQMEFLLKMQVPEGETKAGMAHHKMHDAQWTPLPMLPHLDPQPRYLRPPSTAATLNLAATGAQCARIWETIDPTFAQQCLTAAETAWQAALDNPEDYAPVSDTTGGGPYNDDNVTDEFYWAAAELFITTGEAVYQDYMAESSHYKGASLSAEGFFWGEVAALGDLSLALIPNELATEDINDIRTAIATTADTMVANINTQGYPTPYKPDTGEYVWGSNSSVLNNAIMMAAAYDYTQDTTYRDAVFAAMDYLLGRNGLNQSYITGYGEKASQNQHHRFWANQNDSNLPNPPAGTLAGGPNSGLQDPVAVRDLVGCAPQKCYIDDIESYSTNEVTINWNAPLAWIAHFLSEQANQASGEQTSTTVYLPIIAG